MPASYASGRRSISTAIALAAIHLGALGVLFPALFSWPAVGVALALYYVTGGLGICLGYHRLLTHRSMRVPRALEYVLATFGVLALQGGPIAWVATHRAHHAFSDTERDPHDARRGFWWSHMEWLYRRNPARLTATDQRRFAPDLAADPYYRLLDANAALVQLALGVALWIAGGWPFVVWGIFLRLVVTYHATWLVNSAAHLTGYRWYRAPGADKSTNNWWVAAVAWGEGWHGNHHAFPFSARHGMRWYEFDVTWMTIRALAFCGIAVDVRVPSPAMLARRPIRRARKEVKRSLLPNPVVMTTTRVLTAEHLEPWNGNIVDLTMIDGSHCTGLLQRIDAEWVRLKSYGGVKLPNDGLVRIADAASVARAARN